MKVPFTLPVRHNLADHRQVVTIIVGMTTTTGARGFGEGIPRSFVTGETLAASLNLLQSSLVPQVRSQTFAGPEALRAFLSDLGEEAATAPAAFCAWETALLDAAARSWGLSMATLLDLPPQPAATYSAVLPLADAQQMAHFLGLAKKFRIQHVKLKVGTPDDARVAATVREVLGPGVDLRIDANAAWTPEEAIMNIKRLAAFNLSAVEQPVAKDDLTGLRQVQAAVDIPVIADESLCSLADAKNLIDLGACQMFNLRLSKCGGLMQTRKIWQLAREAGIACQLGCHVGETSILAAAGRHVALGLDGLRYVEGSLAPLYLSRDLVAEPLFIGPGGRGEALPGPGLGVEVMPEAVRDLAVIHRVM